MVIANANAAIYRDRIELTIMCKICVKPYYMCSYYGDLARIFPSHREPVCINRVLFFFKIWVRLDFYWDKCIIFSFQKEQ